MVTAPQPTLLLGGTLRQRRERLKLSRDRLAPTAKVTSSTLEKWESGERIPTLEKLRSWFEAVDANDWYREKVLRLAEPSLWELEIGGRSRRPDPSIAEIRQLQMLPFPACYWRRPTYELLAVNAAFQRSFPGLTPTSPKAARPASMIEWMLLSPLARDLIQDWYRHTHVMVNALQVLGPGLVPADHIDALVASCSRASEFLDMWSTDVTGEDIHNPDLTMLHPSRTHWQSYLTSPYRASTRSSWELFMLTPR